MLFRTNEFLVFFIFPQMTVFGLSLPLSLMYHPKWWTFLFECKNKRNHFTILLVHSLKICVSNQLLNYMFQSFCMQYSFIHCHFINLLYSFQYFFSSFLSWQFLSYNFKKTFSFSFCCVRSKVFIKLNHLAGIRILNILFTSCDYVGCVIYMCAVHFMKEHDKNENKVKKKMEKENVKIETKTKPS